MRHPLFQMGNLTVRNTQVTQHIREDNSHCPTLLLPWRPRQVLLHKPDPLAAALTAAGTAAWASHGRRPGWKVRRAEGATPAHRIGDRAAAGRVARGAPLTLRGRLRPPPLTQPGVCGGEGGPGTLTPARHPPARQIVGARGRYSTAARLLPHPGRGAVAPAAEHFRVPRHLRGPSALRWPAGPRARCCPLVGAQGTPRWLPGGAAARSLGKRPRNPKMGSGVRRQEWRLGC